MAPVPPPPDPQPKPKARAYPLFTVVERTAMHPEWPDGTEVQGVSGATLKGQPKQLVWFRGKIQGRLATPGQHGNLQLKIKWQALPKWGEKAETSNLELWDDRQFPECPVQLRTPAKHVPPGTFWTGDVPQAWLEEPNVPEGATGGDSDQPQTAPGTMTTTKPRKGPPRGHQSARPRSHQCVRQSHVPLRTRLSVRLGQSSRPARRACHGGLQLRRHGVAGTGPQNPDPAPA